MNVSLNFALSLDGKITSTSRAPATFTSRDDLDRLLEIRESADAILIARGTLEADQMTLTVPGHPPTMQPLRCLVSRSGKFNPAHPVFDSEGGPVHLLATDAEDPLDPALFPNCVLHRKTLPEFLDHLATDLEIENLLCEGGGELAKALFELDRVDTIHLTLATHTLFGGREAPTLTGVPGDFLPASRHYQISHFDPRPNGEIFLTYAKVGEGAQPRLL